ncbi:MAG: RluA family pseudouridine synthase [Verrucomicrobia bacterium]|nr:RluA family pseudouridine synthase [Verrucomicrobiota bacterium]
MTRTRAGIGSFGGRIIFENQNFLAVDKPAHWMVHPTRPGGPPTVWDELRQLLAYELLGGGQVSFVNRLDRETSGLLVVAKNKATARHLSRRIERSEISKVYLAICWGEAPAPAFTVDAPILRQGSVRPSRIWLKRCIDPAGDLARTHCRRLAGWVKNGQTFSLIEARPLTGRTHQVRVHLKSAGLPIVGDKIYGPDENLYLEFIETGWTPRLADVLLLDRHALHASGLAFTLHGHRYEFSAPLPDDLETLLPAHGGHSGKKSHGATAEQGTHGEKIRSEPRA